MRRNIPLWILFLGAILFAILFHMKQAGLNLLLFNGFILGVLLIYKRINFRNFHHVILTMGMLLSAVFSVLTNSGLAIFMNYLSMILLSAAAMFPETRSIIHLIGIKVLNVFYGFREFFLRLRQVDEKPGKFPKFWKWVKILVIPIAIILIFVAIYRGASPWFDEMAGGFFETIGNVLTSIFGEIDWWWIATAMLGWLFLVFLLLGKANSDIVKSEMKAKDVLFRRRNNRIYRGRKTALKAEYRGALFLLIGLNLILLMVNSLDVINVWFGFEWEGEYLKQFVHEGTWLLIFSILISIAIILFYFRRNLNFYPKNKALKIVAYAWMIQNIVLAVSVLIRNMHYIDYFNLAYKRIGVIFFILAVIVGVITVMIKISKPKTAFFLLRYNALSIYLIFLIMGFFNWDVIIARHNFDHSETAFVHYDYLVNLDEKALPCLEKERDELQKIDELQVGQFDFALNYMSSELYYCRIQEKIDAFVEEYPERHWLSWNYADFNAYRMLSGESGK
ncbi:MAG: DUF4173 domain-containing protein [Bacteroidales bacterium]|jgi:hypothetical protein|nr:DUF4173 domain-containing protein [Bacteroidales bacterium]